jgi:integrase
MRGQGRLYRRKGTANWWLDYSVRGVRHLESSGTAKHKEAADLLRDRIGQRKARTLVGNPEGVTFQNLRELVERQYALDGNRSLVRVKMALTHLEAFFGADCKAVEISATEIDGYAERRLGEDAARATVNYELAALRRAFRLAVKKRLLSVRPEIEIPAVDNAREGFLSEADMAALLVELPADVRDVVQFLYATGWRVSEALTLTWAHVDREGGTVRLSAGETKAKRGRVFPYADAPSLTALLDARWEAREGPLVFHRSGKPMRSFRRAWARAGLAGRLVHDLRRSAARAFRRAGLSESDIMELCGWETPAMFRRYAIRDEQHLGAQVGRRFGANDTVRRQLGPATSPAPSVSSSAV